MRSPLHLVVLLVGLLAACSTVSPAARREAVPPQEEVLTGHGEGSNAADAPSQLAVVRVSSEGEASTPPGPRGLPLTYERLHALARSRGIGLSLVPVRRNWEVGMAFQRTVLNALDVAPNTESFPTPGRGTHKSGIPDGVLPAMRISVLGRPTFRMDGAYLKILGPENFLEVKALKQSITLSTGRGQIMGFIKVLARQRPRSFLPSALEPPRPALLLLTLSDTPVAQEVADESGRHGVALYQAVAWEDEGMLTVGAFHQLTSFADVPTSFLMFSVPAPLRLQSR